MARQAASAEPSGGALRGSPAVIPGEVEHLVREGHGDLDHVGRSAALQDLDRLGHLERVAGGTAKRARPWR